MPDPIQGFYAAILACLGSAPEHIEPGRWQRFSTNGKRADTSGWCKLFEDLRGGVFGCYRSGVSEVWRAAGQASMTSAQRRDAAQQVKRAIEDRNREQRSIWSENAKRNAALWAECVPLVPGDPVTLYLKRRGFAGLWPLPAVLRLHRSLAYWHEGERLGVFPAMVAPLTCPDGQMVALHRTYLRSDGHKAQVTSVRKLTRASGALRGACIALHKPARGCIGIAEGIETALAAWCASTVPTVAAYSAGNLAAWQWPAGVRRVVVFADNDPTGLDASGHLKGRVLAAGLACDVQTPTDDGSDWADLWSQRTKAEQVPA